MHLLLIHQNFPGQFRDLAPAWLSSGHQVTAIGSTAEAPAGLQWQGLRYLQYQFEQEPSQLERGLAVAKLVKERLPPHLRTSLHIDTLTGGHEFCNGSPASHAAP